MGGDETFLSDLIAQFLTDAPALVEAARAVSLEGTPRRSTVHCTPSSRTRPRSARRTSPISCRELEEVAKGGSLDGVAQRIDAIADQLARVSEALAASRFHVGKT